MPPQPHVDPRCKRQAGCVAGAEAQRPVGIPLWASACGISMDGGSPSLTEAPHEVMLSDDTVRRRLQRLGYVWKRFRYVLQRPRQLALARCRTKFSGRTV